MFAWLQRLVGLRSMAHKGVKQSNVVRTNADYHEDDAVKWFRKSAAKGGTWGQFSLGLRFLKGDGVPPDPVEAAKWFLSASSQGHAMSQYYMGRILEEGLGTAADAVEAYKWFHLSSLQGVREAQSALERMRRALNAEQIAEGLRRAASFVPQKMVLPQAKSTHP